MNGKEFFKVGIAAACVVALIFISGPATGIIFGAAWAAGYFNGRTA